MNTWEKEFEFLLIRLDLISKTYFNTLARCEDRLEDYRAELEKFRAHYKHKPRRVAFDSFTQKKIDCHLSVQLLEY